MPPDIAPHNIGAPVDNDCFARLCSALPLGSNYLGRASSAASLSARTLNRDPAAAAFLAILMGGTLGMLNAFGAVERTRRRRSTQIEEINCSERDSEQAGSPCV
ncbi:hypothetical protein ACVWXQ_000387 [Bradyrhizobium sp. S3.14.4]